LGSSQPALCGRRMPGGARRALSPRWLQADVAARTATEPPIPACLSPAAAKRATFQPKAWGWCFGSRPAQATPTHPTDFRGAAPGRTAYLQPHSLCAPPLRGLGSRWTAVAADGAAAGAVPAPCRTPVGRTQHPAAVHAPHGLLLLHHLVPAPLMLCMAGAHPVYRYGGTQALNVWGLLRATGLEAPTLPLPSPSFAIADQLWRLTATPIHRLAARMATSRGLADVWRWPLQPR
jgi:hypothetical protein